MDAFEKHGSKAGGSAFPEGRFVSVGDGPKQLPSVEGLLLGVEESAKYPGNHVYVFGTKEEVLKVGGNKFLDDKVVEVGALYRIIYVGKASGKRFAYKTFDVFTVDAKTVVAQGLAKDYKSTSAGEAGAATGGDDDEKDDLPF